MAQLSETVLVQVKVTGPWRGSVRLGIARALFSLGARIARIGIIFEVTRDGDAWRSFRRDDRCDSLVDRINRELADGRRLRL
jgi:hypothetical protein